MASLGSVAGCTGGPRYTQWAMASVDAANSGFNERTQFPALELARYAGDSVSVGSGMAPPPVTADDSAFYAFADGTVRELGLDVNNGSGEVYMNARIDASPVGSPAIHDEYLYVPADDGRLYQVAVGDGGFFSDYEKGDVRWSYPEEGSLDRIAGGATVVDGYAVLASESAVHKVTSDGQARWQYAVDVSPSGPVACRDGIAYVGGRDGVVALSHTGSEPTAVWQNDHGTTGHVVAAHDRLFLTDADRGRIVSIARRSATGGATPVSDATSTTSQGGQGTRKTTTDEGSGLDLPTIGYQTPVSKPQAPVGRTEWTAGADQLLGHRPVTAPTITPGALLVGTDRGVVAVDPATGTLLWGFDADVEHLQPVGSGGLVYAVDASGRVRVLDALANGKELTSTTTNLTPSAPPAVFKRTILQTGSGEAGQAIDAIKGTTGVELLDDPIENKRELAAAIDEKTRTGIEDEKMANQALERIRTAVENEELSVGVGREAVRRLTDAERLSWYASSVYYGGLSDGDGDGLYDHLPVQSFTTNDEGAKVPNDPFLRYEGTVHDDSPSPLVERTAHFIASTAIELVLILVPTKAIGSVGKHTVDSGHAMGIVGYADKVDENDGQELLDAAEGAKQQNDPLMGLLKATLGGSGLLSNPVANAVKEGVQAIETAHTSGIEAAKDFIDNSGLPERVQECLIDSLDEAPNPMLVQVPGLGQVITADYILDMIDVLKACLADVVRPGLERLVEQGCGYDTDQSFFPDWEDAIRKSCELSVDASSTANETVAESFEAFDRVALGQALRNATKTDQFDRLKRYDRLPGTRLQTRQAMTDGIQLMRILATLTHEMVKAAKLNLANEDGKTAYFTSHKEVLGWIEETFGVTAEKDSTKADTILLGYYGFAALLDILKTVFAVGVEAGKALIGLGSLYGINHAHSTAGQGILRGKAEVNHL